MVFCARKNTLIFLMIVLLFLINFNNGLKNTNSNLNLKNLQQTSNTNTNTNNHNSNTNTNNNKHTNANTKTQSSNANANKKHSHSSQSNNNNNNNNKFYLQQKNSIVHAKLVDGSITPVNVDNVLSTNNDNNGDNNDKDVSASVPVSKKVESKKAASTVVSPAQITNLGVIGEDNIIYDDSNSLYNAAVIEHRVQWSCTALNHASAYVIMQSNIDILDIKIQTIKNSYPLTDIIVAGEFVLSGLVNFCNTLGDTGLTERELQGLYLETLPDVEDNINGCTDANYADTIFAQLSCLAADNNVALVLNWGDSVTCEDYFTSNGETDYVCPNEDGEMHFNTELAFDKTGLLKAKYYKIHTFNEPEYDSNLYPSASTFSIVSHTGNSVEFSLMTCYDSMYATPSIWSLQNGVTNFIISHWWVNVYPYMSASQWFQAWSNEFEVNLIVAAGTWQMGTAYPSDSSGSGIYTAGTPLASYYAYANINYLQDALLYASVPAVSGKGNGGYPTYVLPECQLTKPNALSVGYTIPSITTMPGQYGYGYASTTTPNGNVLLCSASWTVSANSPAAARVIVKAVAGYYSNPDGEGLYYYEEICQIQIDGCYNGLKSACSNTDYFYDSIALGATWSETDADFTVFPMILGDMGYSFYDPGLFEEGTYNQERYIRSYVLNGKKVLSLALLARDYNQDYYYQETQEQCDEIPGYGTDDISDGTISGYLYTSVSTLYNQSGLSSALKSKLGLSLFATCVILLLYFIWKCQLICNNNKNDYEKLSNDDCISNDTNNNNDTPNEYSTFIKQNPL